MNQEIKTSENSNGVFLPAFCGIRAVFTIVIVAQLLAFVLTLVAATTELEFWNKLALVSLLVQWIALSSASLLCLLHPVLSRYNNVVVASISYFLLLLVTLVISELAYWLILYEMEYSIYAGAGHIGFIVQNMAVSAVVSAVVLRYFYMQYQWRQQIKTEALARFHELQARIRPHFLFNSLNTIISLIRVQPDQAEEAVQDLADLFRVSLGDQDGRISLAREMEIVRHYLHIESLRLGDRLQVEWAIDKLPMELMVPPLLLQPLVENAVYHGIEPMLEVGTIQISGEQQEGMIRIVIENPVDASASPVSRGHQIAIDNIKQRLMICYGGVARLTAECSEGVFKVLLEIPVVDK
ncbi:MAG: sensor histidine kinase [Gammaproteobacteria bacterium]|nr:sensor histidine kinase [Gammaproteobacteria bacterium]